MPPLSHIVNSACRKRNVNKVIFVSWILALYLLIKLIGVIFVYHPINSVSLEEETNYLRRGSGKQLDLCKGKDKTNNSESGPTREVGTGITTLNGLDREMHIQILSYMNKTAGGTQGQGIDNLRASVRNTSIVNPHPFKYTIQPKGLCEEDNLYLIIYIHSAPKQFKRREHIRKTWGNPSMHKLKFALFFALGDVSHDSIFQQNIEEEAERHNDILKEDFEDAYRNLSIKAIGALRWIDFNCPNIKFVFKADDDTFVNTFNYLKYLKSLEVYELHQTNTILCAVWDGATVGRKGKWNVSREDFNASSYPRYCSGCAFTFTADVARAVHRVSYHVPFLWVDDAYITGVLPRAIGNITYKNVRSTYEMNSDRLARTFTGDQRWKYMVSSDIHNFTEAEEVWNDIVQFHETGVH